MSLNKMRGSILVVDDELDLAETIRDLLIFKGFDVEIATDGVHAQSFLAEKKFDLVISDMNMPKMDGLMLVSMINQHHQGTPVVLLSGHSHHDLKNIEASGARAFVSKPIKLDDLLKIVEQNLRINS